MRTYGDVPAQATHGDTVAVPQPGADRPFPGCSCPAPPLDIDAVRFLTEVQVVTVLAAAKASCLQRCPGWPERRDGPRDTFARPPVILP